MKMIPPAIKTIKMLYNVTPPRSRMIYPRANHNRAKTAINITWRVLISNHKITKISEIL